MAGVRLLTFDSLATARHHYFVALLLDLRSHLRNNNMPTLTQVEFSSPNELAAGEQKRASKSSVLEKLNCGGDADDESSIMKEASTKPKKKKAAKKKAATSGDGKEKKTNAPKAIKSETKKRTIRDFYSLSPKQEDAADASPESTGGDSEYATAKITPKSDDEPKKKRRKKAFVSLNDEAKPITVHIPFVGEDKVTPMTIAHCVESKFDLGDEPFLLTGKYYPRTKKQIERFLSGFGRFIH